ncbi:hypothetical protein [Paenibacillus sinopodophylli]|uniref:hypothetical protein n=1 Tax=Paenibacillus sinopodophylli TaxID=1837342 RepID=UPI00110D096D|nr:hypothetical protein [Paenibacillus sinopodophylli]
MYELSRDLFYKAKSLLENGHSHPEIVSIIENNNPGWIFTDQLNSPKSALVWSKGMEGFYLIGDHHNEAFTGQLHEFITIHI